MQPLLMLRSVSVVMRSRATSRGNTPRCAQCAWPSFADEMTAESEAAPTFHCCFCPTQHCHPRRQLLEQPRRGRHTARSLMMTRLNLAFLELRESGEVTATGISCHDRSSVLRGRSGRKADQEHHHKVVNSSTRSIVPRRHR